MIGISIFFTIVGDRKKTKSVRKLQETWTTVTTSLMFIEHCLTTTKYIFFLCTWCIDQDRPILGHGTSLDKFKVIQMCSLTTVKWNLKSITEIFGEPSSIWKLNNIIPLNYSWVKEEIEREIKKYFEVDENVKRYVMPLKGWNRQIFERYKLLKFTQQVIDTWLAVNLCSEKPSYKKAQIISVVNSTKYLRKK